MQTALKMPDLATTNSTIKVVRWLIETGQSVRRGQPLLEVETDKATMDVESIATGKLTTVHVKPGEAVAAGAMIAVIETEDGDPTGSAAAASAAQAAPPPALRPPAAPEKKGGMFARNRQTAQKPAPADRKQSIPLSLAQRGVAQRMQDSTQNIPHFYLQRWVNAEPMIARRQALAPMKIAWDAFFAHAVGRALKQCDRMCLRFEADRLVPSETDAVGVAVDHEGELYVIAIGDPAAKRPEQISDEIRAAVERLRSGDPEAKKLRPANITITNLGAAGVETFAAIVNPPESAILAIGQVAPRAVVQQGKVMAQNRVSITLSVDHRVANGKYAAAFLGEIVRELESL